MSTLLKTEHLKKYYGKKKIVKAVDDVSLEIHAGSSMALIGESGSGKDTIVNYMCNRYGYTKVISNTTRPMRTNDENDKFIKKNFLLYNCYRKNTQS